MPFGYCALPESLRVQLAAMGLYDKKNPLPRLLIILLGITLAAIAAGQLLSAAPRLPPAVLLHLVFAVGILPLILGSISWFTPVLTRSGPPEMATLGPPLLALAAGLLLLYALAGRFQIYPFAASLALAAVLWISWWVRGRAIKSFGAPHPGLLWYRLALGALALGLAAILLGTLWPSQWLPLRRLHLHLNLLGFIGLTALGTWRVLLPTVSGFSDPTAASWLQRQWRPLIAGTLLIAIGAAWWPPLSLICLLLWIFPLSGLLKHPLLTHRNTLATRHGAAPSLTLALQGLWLVLLAGTGHAMQFTTAAPVTNAFILMFLLPLVTGAATHLLPLWFHPESTSRQQAMRQKIGQFGGLRGLAFLAAGLFTLLGIGWGWVLAAMALTQFLLMIGVGLAQSSA